MPRGKVASYLTRRWTGSRLAADPDDVAVEEPMEIRLDGRIVATTMRTPGHDFELAVGFCHAEGLLGDATVRAVKYCRDAGPGAVVASDYNVVTVDTGGHAPPAATRLNSVTSACGMCGSTVVDDLRERLHELVGQTKFPIESVIGLPDALLGDSEVFRATGAVHAAAAFDESGTLCVLREDVGRHNAVDKVVGRLLLDQRLPAGDLGLAVSGRVGFEIIQKAWAAGIGTVVAKGAPTSLAVEAARLGGVTLVGWATAGGGRVYAS